MRHTDVDPVDGRNDEGLLCSVRISVGIPGLLDKHPAADGAAACAYDRDSKVAAMLNGVKTGNSNSSLNAGSDVPHFNLPYVWRQPSNRNAGGHRHYTD